MRVSEPRTVREPHAFARYTAATLLAPTIIATGYTAFDHIQPTLTSLLVTLAVLALGLQQVAWIVTSEVWPGRGWSGPRLVTSRWALLVGAAGSVAVLGYGVAHGRPLLIWALPVASATGVALLAMTRWDAERPRWSVVGGLGPGLVVVGACVVAALGSPAASPVMNAVLVALLCAIAAMVLVGQVWWDRVVHELTVARERVVTQAVME